MRLGRRAKASEEGMIEAREAAATRATVMQRDSLPRLGGAEGAVRSRLELSSIFIDRPVST